MLRRVPLHPLLVAAFPVLLLWAVNADEVWPTEAWPVVAVVIAAGALVTIVAALLLRGLRQGALVASALAVVVLGHGHLWGGGTAARLPGLLVALVLVALAVRAVLRADEQRIGVATAIANVVALALVLGTLPAVVGSLRAGDLGPPLGREPVDAAAGEVTERRRDIVWIVPDRYGGLDGLTSTFDIDNEGFVSALEQRGFAVARDARANYPRTTHSLAAQLNLDYLDDVAATVPDDSQDNLTPLYSMLRDHEVGRVLTGAGYDYVHIGSWWGPTATADAADEVRRYDPTSEFGSVFEETTILPALGLVGDEGELDWRARNRAETAWQLDAIDEEVRRIAADLTDPPRLLFTHLPLPHEPYVFDADGSYVDSETAAGRTRAESFDRQLRYLNERLLGVVDTLASIPADRAPIVLIQADEGPHPEQLELEGRSGFRWEDRPDADLVTKLSILSALRLPGRDADALVRDDMSGVNAMRLILDEYLGTDLGQLPDRSFIYLDEATLYRFEDVTDVLDRVLSP